MPCIKTVMRDVRDEEDIDSRGCRHSSSKVAFKCLRYVKASRCVPGACLVALGITRACCGQQRSCWSAAQSGLCGCTWTEILFSRQAAGRHGDPI